MKKASSFLRSVLGAGCMIMLCFAAHSAWYDEAEWYDEFYQYRIPAETTISSTGLQVLDISTDTIISRINVNEIIDASDTFFDFNMLQVVEYDSNGNITDILDTGTFFLCYDGGTELITNGGFENYDAGDSTPDNWDGNDATYFYVVSGNGGKCLCVNSPSVSRARIQQTGFSTTAGAHYLLSFDGKTAANTYNPDINLCAAGDWTALPVSYSPGLYTISWTHYKQLLGPTNVPATLDMCIERTVEGKAYIDNVSLQKVRPKILISPTSTGNKNYMVYYQPTRTSQTVLPNNEYASIPGTSVTPSYLGNAEKLTSTRTEYLIINDANCNIWFAETTQKNTPDMTPPALTADTVTIHCLPNERQSFQLVFDPKTDMTVTSVSLGALTTGSDTISASDNYVKLVDYVYMDTPTNFTNHVDILADPLVDYAEMEITSGDSDNIVLWYTVIIDADVPTGVYEGSVTISGDLNDTAFSTTIPISLAVHEVAMPDFVTFRSAFGGQHFPYNYDGAPSIWDYHAVTTVSDRNQLVKDYYDVMAENRMYPNYITTGYNHDIEYDYTDPPYGTGVDTPNNLFTLSNFDYTNFDAWVGDFIDTMHVNSICIWGTNGAICNTFKCSGDTRYLAWDMDDYTGYTEITLDQYDNLLKDYFSTVAQHLIDKGWIDYAYIFFDESPVSTYPHVRHYAEQLKSDTASAQIKIHHDIFVTGIYTWKEHDTETYPSLRDLIDIWSPSNDENTGFSYTFYEDYYFSDYGNTATEEEIWNYYTRSPWEFIDMQGIGTRIMPLRNYFTMNANGLQQWCGFYFEHPSSNTQNAWIDPWSDWGNGVVTLFYPPGDTVCSSPDFTIIPAARLEMLREGVEDYEYVMMLEDWIDTAAGDGLNTSAAQDLLNSMSSMMIHASRFSLNDEYYMKIREGIIGEMDQLYLAVNNDTPPAPRLVSPTIGSYVGGTSVLFDWMNIYNADTTHIQVDNNAGFGSPLIDSDCGDVTDTTVAGLPDDGTVFYWRVKAGNSGYGWGDYSEVWNFTNLSPPTAPVLSAPGDESSNSASSINFSWNSSTGATNYYLQIADNAGFASPMFDSACGNNTDTTVAGFPDDCTIYYWRVKGYNAAGWGSYSDAWIVVNGDTPSAPTLSAPADASTQGGSSINFSWNSSTGADNYYLQVDTDTGYASPFFDSACGNVTDTTITGLPNDGTVYYWRVKAGHTILGWSAYSSSWSVTNEGYGEAFSSAFTEDTYTLGLWHFDDGSGTTAVLDSSSNLNSGTLASGFDSSTSWVSSMTGFGTCLSATTTSLVLVDQYAGHDSLKVNTSTDVTFEFWMYPTTSDGNERIICKKNSGDEYSLEYINGYIGVEYYSGGWQQTTDTTTIATDTWTHVAILWDRTSSPTQDTFKFYINGDTSSVQTTSYTGGSSAATDFGMFNLPLGVNSSKQFLGKIDEMRISNILRDYPSDGEGSASSGPDTPSAPTLSAPTDSSYSSGSSVHFYWNSSTDATDYHLVVDNDAGFGSPLFDSACGDVTDTTVTGFPDDGTVYYWKVKAGNTSGWSAYSGAWSFTNSADTPSAPTLSTPTDESCVAGTSVHFYWNSSTGATDYHLIVDDDVGFGSPLFDSACGNATDTTVSGFGDTGVEYYWKVKAGNAAGWSAYSSAWSFTNADTLTAPTLSAPANSGYDDGSTVTFNWNSVTGGTDYHLQVDDDVAFGSPFFDQACGNNTDTTVTGFDDDDTVYYWRVKVKNAAGWWSDYSSSFSFTNGADQSDPWENPFTEDANTLGLWHFDEGSGTTPLDASDNENDGAFDGTLSWVASMDGFDTCLQATGTAMVVVDQYSGHSTLSTTTDIDLTFEFWMYPTTSDGNGRNIIKKYTGGDYAVVYANGYIYYQWYATGWRSENDTTSIATDTWTHVAITVDRTSSGNTDTIKFYIDGELSTTHVSSYPGGNPNDYDMAIFNLPTGKSANYQFLGKLDEIRISDTIRTY
jgi:concanavalin A-like lectin/glucanase superfamily protein/glycosyl hydrolase family 123